MVTTAHQGETERRGHMNMETALKEAMTIDGAVGVCLVDWESGMSLGALGGGKYLDLDIAAAGNTEGSSWCRAGAEGCRGGAERVRSLRPSGRGSGGPGPSRSAGAGRRTGPRSHPPRQTAG